MVITIDGPVASGKSSIAKEIGTRLGLFYLNTGLLYRAVAYILVHDFRKKFSWEIPLEISEQELAFVKDIVYEFIAGEPHVLFKGKDITASLSDAGYDQIASIVSASKMVRDVLLTVQRVIGEKYNIIADGRDCGSVVFPNADYKFFLTASVDVRTQRVLADPKRKVQTEDYDQIKKDIEARDKRDQERVVAPLVVPDEAIMIDSSDLDFEATVQKVLGYVKNYL